MSLIANNLTVVRGDRELFSDLSFSLQSGQLLHIQGSNGTGKTTLLKIICGLLEPSTGEVRWLDQVIQSNPELLRQHLLYLGHQTGIKSVLSPIENVKFLQALQSSQSVHSLESGLEQAGLAGFIHEPSSQLSAGQQRRIVLSLLKLTHAKLWVLDEPFTALDKAGISWLQSVMAEHLKQGGLILLASHGIPCDSVGDCINLLLK